MRFEKDIIACLTVLKNGGLILYPTDTIWGIGCDATNEGAVNKVFKLKNRVSSKSMIILVADELQVKRYVHKPDIGIFKYLNEQQNPTTVIYENGIDVAPNLLSQDGSVAIRIVRDNFCKALIENFNKPIVSTSANISGESSASFFKDISQQIKNGVDYIVQHRQNDLTFSQPSTIIKLNDEGAIDFIRE